MTSESPKVTVTVAEMGAFHAYAAIVAAIAAGMYAVAPKGLGQILGVIFAASLLPVPPLVLYFTRGAKP
jgi:hypothetical protein